MSWESFYFVCFLIGFFFSLLSFLAGFGFLHLPLGLHCAAGHGRRGARIAHQFRNRRGFSRVVRRHRAIC